MKGIKHTVQVKQEKEEENDDDDDDEEKNQRFDARMKKTRIDNAKKWREREKNE